MTARKTFPVQALVANANRLLAHPNYYPTEEEGRAARRAVAALLEQVLLDTDNYRGFRYLSTETEPGGALRPDYDDTRREYCPPAAR